MALRLRTAAGMNASLRSVPALLAVLAVACGSADNTGNAEPNSGKPSSGAPETAAPESPTSDDDLPLAPFCAQGAADPAKTRFQALAPTERAEFMALRQNEGSIPGGLTEDLADVATRGTLCAGAADPAKCKGAYDALKPPVQPGYHTCFTRGDVVGCLDTKTKAMAFLGEVHGLEEAFFIAEYEGYYGQCSYADVMSRGKALADGSFQLAIMKGGGCSDIFRAVINVKRDGTIREVESKKTDLELGCP